MNQKLPEKRNSTCTPLKGSARTFELDQISNIIHQLESDIGNPEIQNNLAEELNDLQNVYHNLRGDSRSFSDDELNTILDTDIDSSKYSHLKSKIRSTHPSLLLLKTALKSQIAN